MRTPDQVAQDERSWADANRHVTRYRCTVCGGRLTVQRLTTGGYVAACPDPEHDGWTELPTTADAERALARSDPRHAEANVRRGGGYLTGRALQALTDQQLAERARHTKLAREGDAAPATLSQTQIQVLVQLARLWQLDPLTDLMIFKGQPTITLDGRLRMLRRWPRYLRHDFRPLSAAEKEAWGYERGDLVIVCRVFARDLPPDVPAIEEHGIVRARERERAQQGTERQQAFNPALNHPQQIAIQRAVKRASRQCVGLDLPPERDDDDVIDVQAVEVALPIPVEVAGDDAAGGIPEDELSYWHEQLAGAPDRDELDRRRDLARAQKARMSPEQIERLTSAYTDRLSAFLAAERKASPAPPGERRSARNDPRSREPAPSERPPARSYDDLFGPESG